MTRMLAMPGYVAARDEYQRACARFADAVKGGARESDVETLRVAAEVAQDRLASVAAEITANGG